MPFKNGIHTGPLPPCKLPDEPLSIFEFLFPKGKEPDDTRPWILDATSDLQLTKKEALDRTLNLAKAFHQKGVRESTCSVIFSPNAVDYGPCLWAVSPILPSNTTSEPRRLKCR